MVNIAVNAARAAGKVITRNMNRVESLTVTSKQRNDFATEVDIKAEQEIINIIRRAYPQHGILAEESGEQPGREDDTQWIIDPLDGTTNYLHGFPQFCVSIAARQRGRLAVGVIYDPVKEELFTASKGEGALLNNRKIRVSRATDLRGALLGTGIPYRSDQPALESYLGTLTALIQDTAGVRRAGSAALDLAYVAAGRLDGFWEFSLNPWDMAAGALIVQEAGGLVGDLRGGHDHLQTGNILAANPAVFKQMLKRLRPITA